MTSTTANMGLSKPDLTDAADVRVLNGNMDKLDGHRHGGGADGLPVRVVQAGPLAARPAAGTAGQLYVATDPLTLYIDNGSSWAPAGQGKSSTLASSNTVPNGTTTIFNIGTGVAAKKVQVFVNGLLREEVADYTFYQGNSYVTFVWAPQSGDRVQMIYVLA